MSSGNEIPSSRVVETIGRIRSSIEHTIRGKSEAIDKVIISLLAGGHVLIEDLPGLGKTTLAHCLARAIDCTFSRIQFTSDMLPSDIIGTSVYNGKEFNFKHGRYLPILFWLTKSTGRRRRLNPACLKSWGEARSLLTGRHTQCHRPLW